VRLVFDTNIAVSDLLWHGAPGQLIDAAQTGAIEIFSSTPLLAELQSVLARAKFVAQLTKRGVAVDEIFDGYAALVTLVSPASITPAIIRDPTDDHVLACALAARGSDRLGRS
jgi:putative PIN family toxin of toxin-antitoxin system